MDSLKPRLYLDQPFANGQHVMLSADHARYLFSVMRLTIGDVFAAFNGRDGVWRAEITEINRKEGRARLTEKVAPQFNPPDLWLLFAPIKKERTDFIVEKAAELGVARIWPIICEFSQTRRVNLERLQSHAVEAAEQCGGSFVPTVEPIRPLRQVLNDWQKSRCLWFCDEMLAEEVGSDVFEAGQPPAAILIGPEGGFSKSERDQLRAMAHSIRLGPRILRADTAAVAALTLWQSKYGDWAQELLNST